MVLRKPSPSSSGPNQGSWTRFSFSTYRAARGGDLAVDLCHVPAGIGARRILLGEPAVDMGAKDFGKARDLRAPRRS